MPASDPSREQAEAAAAEAAQIGGRPSEEADLHDGPERAVAEGGGGESEGFELAEDELIEHASHGDQHAARRAIQDAPEEQDDARAAEGGEPDQERSSERDDDLP
jgi:hypothetical protein